MSNDHSTWHQDEAFWRDFADLMFGPEHFAQAAEQVPQLMALTGLSGGRILDLGCGPGRHSLPLAAAGWQVTAVDRSAGLLADLRRRAEAAGLSERIDVIEADMRDFEQPEAFEAVWLMWTSFGYFEDESDHDAVLHRVYRSLVEGGCLVLDMVGLEYLCRHLQPIHATDLDDGRVLIERPALTEDLTRLDNEWLLIDGDRVRRAAFSHRVWSGEAMMALLRRHGFQIEGVYGDFTGAPYDLDSERQIVVARSQPLIDPD